jgi:hypothetical protein
MDLFGCDCRLSCRSSEGSTVLGPYLPLSSYDFDKRLLLFRVLDRGETGQHFTKWKLLANLLARPNELQSISTFNLDVTYLLAFRDRD